MRTIDLRRCARSAAGTLAVLGLGGCTDYTIETTLDPDGSGVRRQEMIVNENGGADVTRDEFVELMHVSPADGWSYTKELKGDDSVHVFRRETRVRDLASWADVSGDVIVSGTTTRNADETVGYVRLGDVRFSNEVKVETGRVSEGTSYTYRESFYWVDLLDALVEHVVARVSATVEARYPKLGDREVGEIVGITRGRLWAAIDHGLLDADGEEEEMFMAAAESTGRLAVRIARSSYPDAAETFFVAMLRQLWEDEDDRLEAFFEEELPGGDLVMSTVITFRLDMPGTVTDSNAHERDGTTLVWSFGLDEALSTPVEIFAESVVGN